MTSPALDDFPAVLRPRIAALVEAARADSYDSGFKAGYKVGERDAIRRMFKIVPPDSGKVASIKRAVSVAFGVPVHDLSSSRQDDAVVIARQVAIALCREMTPLSTPAIGRHFGGRDHSTIIHAIRRVAARTATDKELAAQVEALRNATQQRAA